MPDEDPGPPPPPPPEDTTDEDEARRVRGRTSWTAEALMATDFPPPRWAVPGILAEGVTLLAGPPKVGKSWLALDLGLTIAAGGRAFGAIDVQAGPVLYLALEDTARRLKTRMTKLLAGRPAPATLHLAITCPALPAGGAQQIAGWLKRHPDARMVVVDVFAKLRGAPPAGASAYDADYAAIGYAKQLADAHGVAVVLVHHVRKGSDEDFLAEVSGTNGLTGAADATLVLKRARGQADGVLHITGRDVDETEHALAFDPATGHWQLLEGTAADHALHDTRAHILRYVRDHPASGPTAIAQGTGLGIANVKKTCQRMAADGQLHADIGGRYRVLGPVPAVPESPDPPVTSTNVGQGRGHAGEPGVPGVPDQDQPAEGNDDE